MNNATNVIEYKCPCCNAGLRFTGETQQLTCEYCDNTFEIDAVLAFNEQEESSQEFQWEEQEHEVWNESEQEGIQIFQCPSCGGEILTDATTAATFCPFCTNPTIMPGRLSNRFKPDAVIPFKTTQEDAKQAFLKLCKGKPLLPKFFTQEQQLEKITGMYVPFWLYDCSGDFSGTFKATRVHTWADPHYTYTKTDHYMLSRKASADFVHIPMDGSTKMEDDFMESIEPFDYADLTEFDTAYLTGFYADKYDVLAKDGEDRIRQRVDNAMTSMLQNTFLGYAMVVPTAKQLNVAHSKAKYVLLPVWMLNTRYKDKIYTFAMNGQTGKMTGSFPVCPKRAAMWFSGIFAAVTAVASLAQLVFG